MIDVRHLGKSFTLHNQGGVTIPVLANAGFTVAPGECVALTGESGAGKSTVMRILYGNYLAAPGSSVRIGGLDLTSAAPREILSLRRETLGYVSQFLRVVPRVPTVDVVAEPLLAVGCPEDEARARAEALLERLRIPRALWSLSPTTFSGGEQQRVNIARGFVHAYPALLLDEPTASLDATNRETVLSLIEEAKAKGAAIVGIFHDVAARNRVADREIDVSRFAPGVGGMSKGRLIGVVGPSGVGKDSLMEALVARRPDLHRVRRVITRPETAGGEVFEGITPALFAARAAGGDFALHWTAHGLSYGVPARVRDVLGTGRDALVNLSRGVLGKAARQFETFHVLHVTARPEVLAARLNARGRETPQDIARRLARPAPAFPPGLRVVEIDNSGRLEAAVDAAMACLYPERV
jgi:alpha-D-ribose 1-methylphosphonate 5-triphosphate synthase subunit PhnL